MLTNHYKRVFLFYYTACFIVCYALLYGSGSLLHQTSPLFAVNKLDLSLHILLLTSLGDLVIMHSWLQAVLDATYLLLPLLLLWAVLRQSTYQYFFAFLNVVYNIGYSLLLTTLSAMSTQWFIGFIFIPLLFMVRKDLSFYYAFHCLRYLFLIVFFTAGLWKIRAGGLLNLEQMSAILLKQHGSLLVSAPENWYASMILSLVRHPGMAYILYLLGATAELFFVVGLFTRNMDRLLLLILMLFIAFNIAIMKINYFPWVAFGFLFWYSKLNEPLLQDTN